jgi:hypothetical protein
MFEFQYKKDIGKEFYKCIMSYYYDGGDNIALITRHKQTDSIESFRNKPCYIEMDILGNPWYLLWEEYNMTHRPIGPAKVEIKTQLNYESFVAKNFNIYYFSRDIHIYPVTITRKIIASKYINNQLIYKKEIKTLKDWFNFDRVQDILLP